MRILAGILALLAGAQTCLAALEWKTTGLQLKTEVGQEQAAAVFPFRNQGDQPVRIVSVDPSCRCMAAKPGKEVYAPGETGEIRVEVALTGYVGRLRRSIAVETDDAAGRFVELTLTVDIPEPVVINPRFLFWRVGDRPEQRSLEIVLTEPKQTALGEIECNNPLFHVQLQPEPAGRYRLAVQPADVRQAAEAIIRLNVTIGGRLQVYVVYVAVK
jgi:hypothetical protein